MARVRSTGKLVGGYTRVAWTKKRSSFKRDATAFLFNNRADGATITKFAVRAGSEASAVYHHMSEGPSFGYADFCLLNVAGFDESYCGNRAYDIPGKCDLAGVIGVIPMQFTVDEIEVFAV